MWQYANSIWKFEDLKMESNSETPEFVIPNEERTCEAFDESFKINYPRVNDLQRTLSIARDSLLCHFERREKSKVIFRKFHTNNCGVCAL